MNFYKNLPVELQVVVLHGFTEKQLFDLIQGKIGEEAQLPVPPVDELRVELFRRRGKEASRYQSALLVSWLKYWARNNQLPFIKTPVDRQAWVKRLDAALRDPESSYEHKIRCCLLINSLHPNSEDLTPSILEFLQAKNEEPYLAREIRAFVANLSQGDMQGALNNFSRQLCDSGREERLVIAQILGGIAPFLSPGAREAMAVSFLNTLNMTEYDDVVAKVGAVRSLSALTPYLSSQTQNQIFDALKEQRFSDSDAGREKAMEALDAMAPYLTQDQKDEVFQVSYDQLNDSSGYARENAVWAMGYWAAHVTQERRQEMLTLLLGKLDQDSWWSVRTGAFKALTHAIPSLSEEEVKSLWPRLLNKLNDENFSVNEMAVHAIAVYAPRLSEADHAKMLELIQNKMGSEDNSDIYISFRALEALAPSLSQAKREAQINALLTRKVKQPSSSHYVVMILSSMVSYATPSQRDQLRTLFLNTLETGSRDFIIDLRNALIGLAHMAPKFTTEQADEFVEIALSRMTLGEWVLSQPVFQLMGAIAPSASQAKLAQIWAPLLKGLNSPYQEARLAAAQALMAWIPRLSLSQLHELLALPSEDHPQTMIVKLMAQTRLHLYQPPWEPAKDLGVDFVRKDRGELHQRRFDSETQTWGEPRTLRLWSQVGGKSQTVDDCIKEVTTRPKINHEWM